MDLALNNLQRLICHKTQTNKPDLVLMNKIKRSWHLVDFAMTSDHRIKIEEREKIAKQLDHARELFKKRKNYGTWKWQWYQW